MTPNRRQWLLGNGLATPAASELARADDGSSTSAPRLYEALEVPGKMLEYSFRHQRKGEALQGEVSRGRYGVVQWSAGRA